MKRPASRLAAALALLTALFTLAGLTILALTLDAPPAGGWGFRGFPAIYAVIGGVLGWLIMTRRPDNRIGLLIALIGLLGGAQLFMTEYAAAGVHQSLPGSNILAAINAAIWVPSVSILGGAIPLLFPDGRLPSPRWRPVAWLMAISGSTLVGILFAFPNAVDTPREVDRLIRLPIDDATLNSASYVALSGLAISVVGAAASVIRRWRHASGIVREQLKWLAASVALAVATMWLSVVPNVLLNAIFIFALGSVLIAVGIAVLRYRLYEIDAVINRSLVFGALAAILTGAFAALQKLLQEVFVAVTGNESDAATVITTLVLATSFVPLRKAIEKVVERRITSLAPALADGTAGDASDAMTSPEDPDAEPLEALLRRVVREELRAAREIERPVD